MEIKWTKQALEGFNNIQSQHFTSNETKEYKNLTGTEFLCPPEGIALVKLNHLDSGFIFFT